mmetsp:Transcript_23652/g.26978  ORF Transcript_23652/g.26978 Transcript_23652/m.26978 type:complete len:1247 (+) Transcript_23652:298-4038(+)
MRRERRNRIRVNLKTITCITSLFICSSIVTPGTVQAADYNSSSSSSSHPSANEKSKELVTPSPFYPTPQSGPIDDAYCNVEQLEEANDSQLYSILEDLKQTTFFRNFGVDLETKCPLKQEKEEEVLEVEEEEGYVQGGDDENENEGDCNCGLQGGNEMMPWEMNAMGSTEIGDSTTTDTTTTMTSDERTSQSTSSSASTPEEDDEHECDGGDIADEMEDDAPPLCELTETEITQLYDPLEQSTTPLHDLLSSALNKMNSKLGWDSESEKDTFMWSKPSDPIVLSGSNEEGCDHDTDHQLVDGELPDTFWLDMCAHIKEGDGIKVVDLTVNPERSTGYNGTHIWRAIYEENCIDLDGFPDRPMCYEERVLYRLLSGLHASTTLGIAKNYYPPNKRKGRENWEPNAIYFYEKFGDHPEYIRNLHFSYVVLLRALKKASPVLYKYEIRTGNIVDDETATILLRRLLDSSILTSCNHVFTAFDESLMFRTHDTTSGKTMQFDAPFTEKQPDEIVALQQNFKGVFHNISSILDCVQCQQCKLHGKMAMLGYGTALKILFTSKEELIAESLSRNEVVAFINTIAKMSEAMKDIRELTHLYWTKEFEKSKPISSPDPLDTTIGLAAVLARAGLISPEREVELVQLAMERNEELLVLAKHYATDLEKFLLMSAGIGSSELNTSPDAIVVGTGLAGLSAALNILDRGGMVLLIEKEHSLGGNSNKASSGINACCPNNSTTTDDLESFKVDATKSAGASAQPILIQTLVENSADAVTWLKERVGVDLSLIAQLGGHKHKRTHRPKNGMVGAEIIYGMQKAVKQYEKSGMVKILTDTKVAQLLRGDDGSVVGVEVEYLSQINDSNQSTQLNATNVILATGGFAADRSEKSYLASYRPELLKMPATAGGFSTGDGISLATAAGAGLVDMEKVQIHPTGWVDPTDPYNPNKILAAELMRGVGGILINDEGKRFCNELGTRAYVTDMMLSHDEYYRENRKWNKSHDILTFALVLSSSAALDGKKHVDHYTHKGLLQKIDGIKALAEWMHQDVETVRETLLRYRKDAETGKDQWGKTAFQGLPSHDLDDEVFYAGRVSPVLHYCMGGITIDSEGNVLDENKNVIKGLYAAGEVTGGVHGDNRLGGNSLLECTVYGTIVGKKVPIKSRNIIETRELSNKPATRKLEDVSMRDLAVHNTPDDCWVAIHGYVYDLTSFAEDHPAGAESIHRLVGQDGTEAFQSVHNQGMMEDFEEDLIGKLLVD